MSWLLKASRLKFMKFSSETNEWPANSSLSALQQSELMDVTSRERQRPITISP